MNSLIYLKEHRLLASKLKKARIEAGFNQTEASKKLGRSQSYISKIEAGQRRIDIMQLKRFARAYKKPLDFFID